MTDCSAPKDGFTLLELSIVLTVIGLVAGGVMVGSDLIIVAKLNKVITQFQKYDSAFNAFKTKYGCLPGDCRNLNTFFPTLQNGDGDGYIAWCYSTGGYPCTVYYGGYDYTHEMANGWAALSQAGLIAGKYDAASTKPGVGFPLVEGQFNNGIIVGAWNTQHYFRSGLSGGGGGGVMPLTGQYPSSNTNSFTPVEALYIDTKIDDGTPVGGIIKWVTDCEYNCFQFTNPTQTDSTLGWSMNADGPLGAISPHCYNSAANAFNTAFTGAGDVPPTYETGKTCNVAIPASF